MKPLQSVLIVEPSEIVYQGLRSLLVETGRFNILAQLAEATSLDDRLPSIRPDLLIVNPTLLSSTPKQQLASYARLRPAMPVVALVYQYVERSLLDNFRYVIDIRDTRSTLLATISSALNSDISENDNAGQSDNYELSDRETDVLVLVAKGLSSKEIADKLHISVHTVNSHRKNITHKTGIRSVAGLAVYAMIHNLMET
jgi:DNA-binding NarL/FixJ family response regulator